MSKRSLLLAGLALASSGLAQIEPGAGQWATWTIPSGSALRLPPPPDSAAAALKVQPIRDCVAQQTPASLAQIRYWDAGAPSYRGRQMTEILAFSKGLATPLQTRALALVSAAIYDTMVAAWDSKS